MGLLLLGSASALRVCGPEAPPAATPSVAVVAEPAAVGGRLPAARHGGRVQLVGGHALETVAARSGGVALFWMDLQGNPIPPAQVNLSTVRVVVNGAPRDVPVQVVNDAFVARVNVPASAPIAVTIPQVVVAGETYEQVVAPTVVVVAVLPGIIVVPTVQVPVMVPVMVHGKHRKFRGGWGVRFR